MKRESDTSESKATPDPATTYERAKPEQQSPGGKLVDRQVDKVEQPDSQDKQNKSPNDPKAASS